MAELLIPQIPFSEGRLALLSDPNILNKPVIAGVPRGEFQKSQIGRHPPEIIRLCQQISSFSGVSHALCATHALENYLGLEVAEGGQALRQIIHNLSFVDTAIFRFYFVTLRNYLNNTHTEWFLNFPYDFSPPPSNPSAGDISTETSSFIFKTFPAAQKTLFDLKKSLGVLCGKYPGIMNPIPGGVTNFNFGPEKIQEVLFLLQNCVDFVTGTFVDTVLRFSKEIRQFDQPGKEPPGFISFGKGYVPQQQNKNFGVFLIAQGTVIDDKFESISPFKVSRSKQKFKIGSPQTDFEINSAFYNRKSMESGALARILVSHYSGTNPDAGDILDTMFKELKTDFKTLHRPSSRILAEAFESQLLIREAFVTLLNFNPRTPLSQKTKFSFMKEGVGSYEMESPCGSIIHRVAIDDNRIQKYEILPGSDWNLALSKERDADGPLHFEIGNLTAAETSNPIAVSRIVSSFSVSGTEVGF